MPDKDNFNCVVAYRVGGVLTDSRSDVYAATRGESLRNRVYGRTEQHAEISTENGGVGAGPTVALNILQDPIYSKGISPCISKGSANGECAIGIIALDRASYNQGKNASYDIGVDEGGTAFTVTAKGPGLVKE